LQRGRKIGRPGKEDRAMEEPTLESKLQRNSSVEFRYIKTAGLAGLVCGANVRPKNSLWVEAVAMKQKLKS
jgi:hypothetical protein